MGYFQLKTGYQKYGQVTTSTIKVTSTVKVLLLMNPVLVTVRFRKNRVRMSVTVWPSVFILATSSWNIKKNKTGWKRGYLRLKTGYRKYRRDEKGIFGWIPEIQTVKIVFGTATVFFISGKTKIGYERDSTWSPLRLLTQTFGGTRQTPEHPKLPYILNASHESLCYILLCLTI